MSLQMIKITPNDASDDETKSCIITYMVMDTLAPVIICPDDVVKEWTPDLDTSPTATGEATAEDNCDPNVIITYADNRIDGDCAGSFVIERSWIATDSCGNEARCIQKITIEDTTAPEIVCPADTIVEWITDLDNSPISMGEATATDACDSIPAITYEDNRIEGNCAGDFVIERTWFASDVCGNESSCTQIITAQDTQAPTIACPADTAVEWITDMDLSPASFGEATATDACDQKPRDRLYRQPYGRPIVLAIL